MIAYHKICFKGKAEEDFHLLLHETSLPKCLALFTRITFLIGTYMLAASHIHCIQSTLLLLNIYVFFSTFGIFYCL